MLEDRGLLRQLLVATCAVGLLATAISGTTERKSDPATAFVQPTAENVAGVDSSKTNLHMTSGRPAVGERDQLLWEDFEEGTVPPTGWTLIQYNAVETWKIEDYDPYEGQYAASCNYDDTYSDDQNEWLISRVLDFSGKSDLKLIFYWCGSYYWSVDPYDNCDLIVRITTDGSSWTDLWTEDSVGVFSSWIW